MRAAPILFALLSLTATATAGPPHLGLPIDCDPGRSCWIANYVDHDPTQGLRDYACGTATYNGTVGGIHQGTDFAIRDLAAMRDGVAVLAAAPGRVVGARDGIDDVAATSPEAVKRTSETECGNGVRIDHGDGWSTQYCHMRKGSIAVRSGDTVKTGQALGLVGLSGLTEYPHLHIGVRKGDTIIDPFVGETDTGACGPGKDALWWPEVMAKLPYGPTAIYNAGFAPEAAAIEKVRAGAYDRDPPRDGAALVVWVEAFQVRAGDRFLITLAAPDGKTILRQSTDPFPKDQARRYAFVGRKTPSDGWPPGDYTGTIQVVHPKGGDRYGVVAGVTIRATLR